MAEVVVNNKMLLVIYLSLFLFTVFLMTDWESKKLSLKTTASEHADLPQEQLAMVNWPKLSEAGMMKQARHQAILDIEYLQRLYALATDLLGLSDAASIARGTAIYHEIFSQDLKASFFGPGIETIQKTGIDPDILVEQAELTRIENQNRRKESDLRGAIDNDQKKDADESQNEKDQKSNENGDPEDYQLSRAFDLILALTLINNKTIQ